MQLTAIFLTVCSLTVAARSASQSVSFTGKNVELEKVFQAIETQTGYFVLYEKGLLKNAERVTVNANNVPLNDFLSEVLNNQPLTYSVQSTTITIERKVAVSVSPKLNLESSPPPITGIIRDADGNPLQGVNVVVKGTKRGITTDAQGKFSIDAKENDVLVISSIGYNAKEVKISSVNVPHIVALDKSVSELDEVQYIAYGTQTRRFSVGNVTTVKGEEIARQPLNNPMLALQGRVPGLNVTQESGINGGGVKIRIQGENSIRNGNNPLIIVDGIPYPSELPFFGRSADILGSRFGSPLGFINLNDIESIEVLKDADATSIYGSRAANGAILITTKKGKPGKMRASLNIQQGWSEVPNKMEMMNARQYLDMRYEGLRNAALVPTDKRGLPLPDLYAPDLTVWDTTRNTDWQKELIGATAQFSNYNFSVSGGNENSNYMIGLTYNRNTDVFPGDHDMEGTALHFNLNTASLNQKFKVQLTGTFTNTDNSLPGSDLTAAAIRLVPVAPPLVLHDTLNWAPDPTGRDTWDNPLASSFYQRFKNITRSLYSNGSVSYNVARGLDFRCQFGYNTINTQSNFAIPLAALRPAVRPFETRIADFNNSTIQIVSAEPQLTYTAAWGKAKLDVLTGSSLQHNTTESITMNASGYTSDLLMEGVNGASVIVTNKQKNIYKYNALFGRIGLIWDEKYLVVVNGRRDGSSRFGPARRFNSFGSIGVGWIFSEEIGINHMLPWLSFGKLRTTYGTTGSDQIADYQYLSANLPLLSGILYHGSAAMSVRNLHNPYLQWEETRKWQAGLDIGFWWDRILLSVTYTRNRSSNQLIEYALPFLTGFGSVTQNFPATLQNTSWEIVTNTSIVKSRDFKWTTSINLTVPKNKVMEFPEIEQSSYAGGNSGIVIGQPKGVQRISAFKGIDPNTGTFSIADEKGNPVFQPPFSRDVSHFRSFAPIYYGGFQNNFSVKLLEVNFLVQYMRQWGTRESEFWNGADGTGFQNRGSGNQPISVLNRWRKPGDNASHPPFPLLPFLGIKVALDIWLNQTHFIRLMPLTLG